MGKDRSLLVAPLVEIPAGLAQGHTLGRGKTALKSWFAVDGASNSISDLLFVFFNFLTFIYF